jgi:hypothetical protein
MRMTSRNVNSGASFSDEFGGFAVVNWFKDTMGRVSEYPLNGRQLMT